MSEAILGFDKRFKDRLFTKWKGGRYRFFLYDNEVEFYAWIFENGLTTEINFKQDKTQWSDRQRSNPFRINFKTGETFMAFKLTWL